IGDLSEGAFAVLAPATPPEHALKMARRPSLVIETAGPRPAGVPPLRVHAGHDAAANAHATPLEPGSRPAHAGSAPDHARPAGPAESSGTARCSSRMPVFSNGVYTTTRWARAVARTIAAASGGRASSGPSARNAACV